MKKTPHLIAGLAGLALIVAAFFLWRHEQRPAPEPASDAPPVAAAPPAEPVASAASEPAILHPIEVPAAALQASAPTDFASALADLFDRQTVLAMFQTDDFARRFVATVDNLGRPHASAALWPVNPTAGRLGIDTHDDTEVLGAGNAQRYAPFVGLVESVDLRKAVATYARLYPQFQQAYADLGYPKGYFNDRLVEVIDQLLATPDVDAPLKIRRPQFTGPVQPDRPWVMYEFDDPALQKLTAGQKILLRMGPDQERRMKRRLVELRALLTQGSLPRGAPASAPR